MESCLKNIEKNYNTIEDYKENIDKIIKSMISKNERVVFAAVSEKAKVTPFTIRQYPELRNYILNKIKYYKEIQVINKKIDKAVNCLVKLNKRVTFLGIANRCKFNLDDIYKNKYIKERIRSVLINNS